jgi:hypothetical protein
VNCPSFPISLNFWVELVGACNSIWYQSQRFRVCPRCRHGRSPGRARGLPSPLLCRGRGGIRRGRATYHHRAALLWLVDSAPAAAVAAASRTGRAGAKAHRDAELPLQPVSAIKPYEGFGDVDHTIKELMSL